MASTLKATGLCLVHAIVVLLALTAVTLATAPDPGRQVREAHDRYGVALTADSAGDPVASQQARAQAILAYRRLESHAMVPHVRYHLAHLMLLDGDSTAALAAARHGLVDAPRDPLLLGIAAALLHGADADSMGAAFRSALADPLPADTAMVRVHAQEVARFRAAVAAARDTLR